MANRTIKIYKDYFNEFYVAQTDAVRRKINYCLNVVRSVDRVPKTILRSMENTDGLYEIRVEVGSNIFRIFCCFDEGSLVILFNGFQKKTQKTPPLQLERAKKIMKEYFKEKENG
ncbi:type II toxin-antitoxin system RelE/ParE family toxin [Paramuribaculum intestinale]|jgi:phage-related protein|uniref:Type II toxin-antitoxin system RelE/ParE family toxin n=1 Tax=Paramuribaculum intestinale TaxID=2094151 RepID=A0A2V1IUZ8_9BACT|nr:type II toxin-antitoxin system RelE/ParE family toxin [Paramuribaculum intestinale]PWB06720.1 type II toxin-antitoxin system RelE/ParE family toxin [Paramuribaculum intestinale]PWB10406.1 type II toxin-antitoxin system RelE/ParE family toxin [Paramuribaculum intestinale]WLT40940.1 type II toxin-antitoxin system RelE/ParE family toxin [Paramuribaculum intestinale]